QAAIVNVNVHELLRRWLGEELAAPGSQVVEIPFQLMQRSQVSQQGHHQRDRQAQKARLDDDSALGAGHERIEARNEGVLILPAQNRLTAMHRGFQLGAWTPAPPGSLHCRPDARRDVCTTISPRPRRPLLHCRPPSLYNHPMATEKSWQARISEE